ncbi:MAG: phage portal protein, partial [Pseudomonadota bacterium]
WPFSRRADTKSAVSPLVALSQLGQARWGSRSAGALMRDGYLANAVAYRCVRMVSEAAASVPLVSSDDDLSALLSRPLPDLDGTSLLQALHAHLQISGNAYLEAVQLADDEPPGALFVLRPDRMKAHTGLNGWIEGWTYEVGRTRRRLERNVDGWLPVLQVKLFHPGDDTYGLAPLSPARKALDLHSGGADWQKALLDNSARPSGALVYGKDGAHLTDEQFTRLKDELESAHSGPGNAGRPLLLEGGLEWKPMSLSPADMDFQAARNAAAREIALAFGVPPMLLGIPGDNTYSNYREANAAFWKMTVLPLAQRVSRALSNWLVPRFPRAEAISCRIDSVPALALERAELFARLDETSFLTDEEKRSIAGLAPLAEDAQ